MLDSRLERAPPMPKVLIISASDLRADLGNTVLWRSDIERDFAPDIDRAMEVMRTQVPNLVVIDAAPPDAPGAIRRLRVANADWLATLDTPEQRVVATVRPRATGRGDQVSPSAQSARPGPRWSAASRGWVSRARRRQLSPARTR